MPVGKKSKKTVAMNVVIFSFGVLWFVAGLRYLWLAGEALHSPSPAWGDALLNGVTALALWAFGAVGVYLYARRSELQFRQQHQSQENLAQSENRYQRMVERSPLGVVIHQNGLVAYANPASLKMMGMETEAEALGKPILSFIDPAEHGMVLARIAEMTRSGNPGNPVLEHFLRPDGERVEAVVTSFPVEYLGAPAFQAFLQDVSSENRLQRAMQSIEKGTLGAVGQEFFASAVSELAQTLGCDRALIGEYLVEEEAVQTLAVWKDGELAPNFTYSLQGTPCQQVINRQTQVYPCRVEEFFPQDESLQKLGITGYLGVPLWRRDGSPSGIIVALYRSEIKNIAFAQSLVQIFASRVEVELERSRILEDLQKGRALFETIVNTIPYEIWVSDKSGTCVLQNPVSKRYWGDTCGKQPADLGFLPAETQKNWRKENLKALHGETVHERKQIFVDGKLMHLETTIAPIWLGEGVNGFVGINIDVSERVEAEARMGEALNRLSALREIDQHILSGTDMHSLLETVTRKAVEHLRVDAAEILGYDQANFSLEILARRNLYFPLEKRQFRAHEDISKKAALERTVIFEDDFPTYLQDYPHCSEFKESNFKVYIALPLIAKGTVRGVLELFHHEAMQPSEEWWEFAWGFANQAAIGIDNLLLFQGMERSNAELALAYELTLEGWSRALELRDQETEGHTQRVTGMTIELAKMLGMPSAEIFHLRRGALLHDIGKMGIPDTILHKPGALSEAEWAIVREHPQTALNLLSPIPYLRLALDIPYAHHERWNGSGYPRGLRGRAIPLSARIFAVADVWDALISERPYKRAQSKEEALAFLTENSGVLFDPQVVEMFTRLVG